MVIFHCYLSSPEGKQSTIFPLKKTTNGCHGLRRAGIVEGCHLRTIQSDALDDRHFQSRKRPKEKGCSPVKIGIVCGIYVYKIIYIYIQYIYSIIIYIYMYLKKNNVDILKSNVLLNILNICIYDQQKRFFVFYG
jgi:hypothetical protein